MPAVGARRLQLNRDIEAVIATALEAELGPGKHLAARLAAASLIAALATIEEAAAAHMEQDGRGLTDAEIDRFLDDAIADHFGWAVAVTASADHEVVDRRRIELVEPGVTPAPIHYESRRLDVAATTALVAEVRASVARATSAALDELAAALSAPIVSISLRTWPPDFPTTSPSSVASPYEARADAIMYRQVLAELAHARGWDVHFYDAKDVMDQAVGVLGERADEVLPVRGRRWGRRGRRTTRSRSPPRSWPPESAR